MAETFNWSEYLNSIVPIKNTEINPGALNYQGIVDTLKQGQKSYTQTAFPAILPLLQPGQDPYMQQAINQIVEQGKLSKQRSISDVTTEAQKRGLTGSSIESGDIGQASYMQELGQQGQISNIMAQDASQKHQQLVNFLTQAYGMDIQSANQYAQTLAQVMGEEMSRQQEWDMFNKSLKANKRGWFEQLLPSLVTGGASIGASMIGASSTDKLTEQLKKLGIK
jgi:hypothetical protein